MLSAIGFFFALMASTRLPREVLAAKPAERLEVVELHSASIVLIDPRARLVGLFRPPLDAAAIGTDLLNLVNAH